jgi:dephospho-CoA kinase
VTVVGLTGPIGSGKSVVLSMLAEMGAATLRADDASRELLARDSRLVSEVRDALGVAVFDADGSLNRPRTAALIFRDPEARARLERVLHPQMVAWLAERVEELRASPQPPAVVVIEAAILTHMGARDLADTVVRVQADRETCLARIMARDGVSRDQAAARLALHENLGLFDEAADHVIPTGGTLEDTRRAVQALWPALAAP